MGLSSNILWHQTKKEGLKGIISARCLYYSYSIEDLTSMGYNARFAYPMISVCDLPLSETGKYLKKYGDYTIGFSAEWGRKHNFSTVWYCDKNSLSLQTIMRLFTKKIQERGSDINTDVDYQRIVHILSHIKMYEGPLPKRNYKNYRFYDERELRLVPDYKTLSDKGESPILWDYEEYKKSHKNSALLPKELNIPYEWADIKYVIVEKQKEKQEFKELIEKQSGRNDLNISFLTNKEVKDDIIGQNHDVLESSEISFFTESDINDILNNLKIFWK